jgi:hypothetical protein
MKDTAAPARVGEDRIDVERALAVRLPDDARRRTARLLVHGHGFQVPASRIDATMDEALSAW